MIDNFDKILPLLIDVWDTYTIPMSFHVQILQRSKDGHDKSSRLVTEWFVGSEQRIKFLMPAIKGLCETYEARCYINLNPKRDETVMWKMLKNTAERLETKSFTPYSMLSSAHDSCQGHGIKRWIVDIDNVTVNRSKLIVAINKCQSGQQKNFIVELPTKNGTHLITSPFDLSQLVLPEGVEVKKNNPTILYCS